jgi:hypothetical protein
MTYAPLPDYVTDLLLAAKATLAFEEISNAGYERLGNAVEIFERKMPVTKKGDVFTETLARSFLRKRKVMI